MTMYGSESRLPKPEGVHKNCILKARMDQLLIDELRSTIAAAVHHLDNAVKTGAPVSEIRLRGILQPSRAGRAE